MKNQELAQIFYKIASFLEMEGVTFKSLAYKKAALVLENLGEDIAQVYQEGGTAALEKMPGIGKSIAQKIEEYLNKGKIKYYEKLRKKVPIKIEELTAVEGLGPKMVKALYQKLGVKNLKDLTVAAKSHEIASLPGFGEKTAKNILAGIAFLEKSKGRFLLGDALSIIIEIENGLKELPEAEKVSLAGSVRRKKDTIGDVDFLVVSKKPKAIMDFFVSLSGVAKIWAQGKTKSSIRLEQDLDVDLRVVSEKSHGSALQYFTGSKEHNIAVRKIAQSKKLKLNEYGVFSGKKMIAGKTEREVYQSLGLDYIPPELRENRGEIEAVHKGSLPKLIELKDIKGDLHCHTDWDGGKDSIKEMAATAIVKGYDYLGITDHTKFLQIENGLDENQLVQQRKEINSLNARFKKRNLKFRLLQGAETNILRNGTIDIRDEALKKLDYVAAGVHSSFKMSKEEMTRRIIKAMRNPQVKIIVHPTGRILKLREGYRIDFDKILRVARETNTILEINAQPRRLDLDDVMVKKAKEAGVKMVINTDSHEIDHLRFMELGVAQARRGWAEKKDIINTYSLDKLLRILKL